MNQADLFEAPAELPAGFRYAEGFITAREEQDLVRALETGSSPRLALRL
jgi:hypothetical protein